MNRLMKLTPLVLAGALTLAACGSSGGSDSSTAQTTTTAAASGASTTAGSTVEKVSANDASQEEIAAALTAAGVDNADRWADEVVEYRPYDDADQGFPHLREELAKYNPPAGTIDQIIAVLNP